MSLFSTSIFSGEINFFSTRQRGFNEEVSKNLCDFVCYHQGEFIQYTFLAGEYHKALKDEFLKEKKNYCEIKNKHDELIEYLNEKLGDVVTKSFELIKRFYRGRHLKLPRICIKVNFDPEKKIITELFREHKVKYIADCSVDENKGFQYIKENGKYFLCQDIPSEIQKGEYFNPRLVKEAVSNYKSVNIFKRYFRSKSYHTDDAWVNCWKRIETDNGQSIRTHYRNCYKSTLIIPLTLLNNNLDKRFLKKFNIENVNRTIFGYLCFDHIETNYFNPVADVDFGYIFGDVLSLYLLVRFMYVDQSSTYTALRDFLKKNSP